MLFVFSVLAHEEMLGANDYVYPRWSITVGWLMTGTTVSCIPLYIIYKFVITPGSFVNVSNSTHIYLNPLWPICIRVFSKSEKNLAISSTEVS